MKPFQGTAEDGIEKALRRGAVVPEGAVNLAWAKAPKISPKNNLVIIDTSRIVAENQIVSTKSKRLAYANSMGILEDESGNQVWEEEYPIISDVFTVDENYTDASILPYLHVSRHFHLDFAGLAMPGDLFEYNYQEIKIVDKNGNDFVDENGDKRYKIYLYVADHEVDDSNDTEAAYRVYAFYDADLDDELYFSYNKVEIGVNNKKTNNVLGYKEIINARTYFRYNPEESDVIDHSSLKQKVYSSKPVALKEQILGMPSPHIQGWKLFVPRKAIYDTRVFQLFRWRLGCEFIRSIQVDPTRTAETIKAGLIVTNSGDYTKTNATHMFYNLNRTSYNFTNAQFINPLQTNHSDAAQQNVQYWYVDFDTVTLDQLKKFDFLVWCPNTPDFNLADPNKNYLPKINFFVENVGGTIIFDTANGVKINGLGISTSAAVNSRTGVPSGPADSLAYSTGPYYSATTDYVIGSTLAAQNFSTEPIFQGNTNFGGINFDANDFNTVSAYKRSDTDSLTGFKYLQYIKSYPEGYRPLIKGNHKDNGQTYATLIHRGFSSGGNIFYSTMGVAAHVSYIFSPSSGHLTTSNNTYQSVTESPIFTSYYGNYDLALNSLYVEGQMKLMLNLAYYSTRLKSIDNADEFSFSTAFSTYTDWFPSWVIKADNDVLNREEKQKYGFVLSTTSPNSTTPVWQRTLSTKTMKQLIDSRLTDEQKVRVQGATRKYTLYVTNPEVKTLASEYLEDSTVPHAWTLAYTPKFIIPSDFGPHVVREEEVKGEYDAGSYSFKTYPPKPFTVQLNSSYVVSSQNSSTIEADVNIYGIATETIEVPPRLITPGTESQIIDMDLYWSQHGNGGFTNSPYGFQSNAPHAIGIENWQEQTYFEQNGYQVNLNWPYWGANVVLSQARGSTGDWVRFVQDAMNRFFFFRETTGYIAPTGQGIKTDGIYGSVTHNAVKAFQALVGARWVDGIVDAETWSLIGWMIIRIRQVYGTVAAPSTDGGYFTYYDWPEWYMQMHRISDGDRNGVFMKRSWVSGGSTRNPAPFRIMDSFQFKFNEPYEIHGVTMVPYLHDSQARTQIWDWLHVGNSLALTGVDVQQLVPGTSIKRLVEADIPSRIDLYPTVGDSIAFGIAQDQPAGYGAARVMGIRDMIVHAKKIIPGTPPVFTMGRTETKLVTLSHSQRISVKTGEKVVVTPTVNYSGEGTLSSIIWNQVTVSSPLLSVGVTSSTQSLDAIMTDAPWIALLSDYSNITFNFTHQIVTNDVSGAQFIQGPTIGYNGTTQYRTMTPSGRVDPYSRSDGLISKQDGVRLICDERGNPAGFPGMPSNWTAGQTFNSHFTKLTMNSLGTDSFVYVGFYDKNAKEFIQTPTGAREISYIEYATRGPQNVYIGVVCKYEVDASSALPEATDAPSFPYRWAMPVYGVSTGARAKIQLEPLPQDLGVTEIWPVPVRTGSYSRPVKVRSRSEGALTTFLKDYQGQNITAYYSVPEANKGPWSDIYGRPYVDVKDETPIVIDDNVIQVKQAPILITQEPTGSKLTLADPWRPVLKVWKRLSLHSAWEEIPHSKITDYNVRTGTIHLEDDLYGNDANLVKVSYTTSRAVYSLKHDGTTRINLNPFINDKQEWLNKPLYIYHLPEFCTDYNNVVIDASVRQRTLQLSESKSIFDPTQSDYNPLAVMLGVIYITSSFDLNDLVLLDTRRRGGGASVSLDEQDLIQLVQEASSYWDVNYNHASTYQKGGFVIIRLPADLKNDLDESVIIETIERNITAGVRYRIEDLEGNRWT